MPDNSGKNKRRKEDPLRPYMWKPGQCGNPGGRPRKQPITERYLEALEVKLPDEIRIKLGLPKGATMGDALARRLTIKAISGSVDAAREIADRVEGKPLQAVKVEGADLPAPIFEIHFTGKPEDQPALGGHHDNEQHNEVPPALPGQTE
jgi:hypothetical protein